MLVQSMILAVAGTASAIFLGYCVYYDHRRRMDPEYRRKVHERREREQAKVKDNATAAAAIGSGPTCGCGGCGIKASGALDFSDQAAMERYSFNEIRAGQYLLSHGQLDEGLTHIANAIELCTQPEALLQMMQATLPPEIFLPLVQKLQEHTRHGDSSETSEHSLSNDADGSGSSDTSLPIPLLHGL